MSKTYFITRHAGAKDWANDLGFDVEIVEHFDVNVVQAGDKVLGTLPVHLAAKVCRRGGQYFHLVLDIPADMRGKEMTADTMRELGATLEEFIIS